MDRPDLAALVAYWQKELRVQDWRINILYTPDLSNSSGEPVYGLCNRLVDNKTATIQIRDPATPAPTSATPPSIEEIIIHELSHLLVAPLAGSSPADIAAEEQMVWAFSAALIKAKGTPQQSMVARAMCARVESRSAAVPKKGPTMDPKIVSAAIAAIKSGDGNGALAMLEKMLVAAAGGEAAPEPAADPGEAAKAPPPAAPPGDDKKPMPPPPAAAVAAAVPVAAKVDPPPAAARVAPDPLVLELAGKVQKFEDERAARIASDIVTERAALAGRAGLSPTLAAIVKDPKTSIETARQIADVAKAPDAIPTLGNTQGSERSARLPPAENAELSRRMGLKAGPDVPPVRWEGVKKIFGVIPVDQKGAVS